MESPYPPLGPGYGHEPSEPDPNPYVHDIGDVVQLLPRDPAFTVVERCAGSFGAVYFLESPAGVRSAAKTPRADLGDAEAAMAVFVEEATMWSGLPHHPWLLKAHHVVAHAGRPYVHMEWIPPVNQHGASLAALVQGLPAGGALAIETVLWFAGQIAEVLDHIERHDSAFVHGDIKPENLLVRRSSSGDAPSKGAPLSLTEIDLVLSDFGMARAAGAFLQRRRAGDVGYLAPEQLNPTPGQRAAADAATKASDMYAVGCTLFELLVMRPRQQVDFATMRIGYALGTELDIEALRALRPDAPRPVLEILAGCLSFAPESRPESYGAFAEALRDAMLRAGGESIPINRNVPTLDGYEEVKESALLRYLVDRRGLGTAEAAEYLMELMRASQARALDRLHESDEILARLDRRLPNFAPVVGSVAHNEMLRERWSAVAHFERAIEAYEADPELRDVDVPGFAGACCNLAQLLGQPRAPEEHTERGLEVAEIAIALTPISSKAHLSQGMIQLRAQRVVDAARAFATAAALDPANPTLASLRACCAVLRRYVPTTGEDPDPEAAQLQLGSAAAEHVRRGVHAYIRAWASRT